MEVFESAFCRLLDADAAVREGVPLELLRDVRGRRGDQAPRGEGEADDEGGEDGQRDNDARQERNEVHEAVRRRAVVVHADGGAYGAHGRPHSVADEVEAADGAQLLLRTSKILGDT